MFLFPLKVRQLHWTAVDCKFCRSKFRTRSSKPTNRKAGHTSFDNVRCVPRSNKRSFNVALEDLRAYDLV